MAKESKLVPLADILARALSHPTPAGENLAPGLYPGRIATDTIKVVDEEDDKPGQVAFAIEVYKGSLGDDELDKYEHFATHEGRRQYTSHNINQVNDRGDPFVLTNLTGDMTKAGVELGEWDESTAVYGKMSELLHQLATKHFEFRISPQKSKAGEPPSEFVRTRITGYLGDLDESEYNIDMPPAPEELEEKPAAKTSKKTGKKTGKKTTTKVTKAKLSKLCEQAEKQNLENLSDFPELRKVCEDVDVKDTDYGTWEEVLAVLCEAYGV